MKKRSLSVMLALLLLLGLSACGGASGSSGGATQSASSAAPGEDAAYWSAAEIPRESAADYESKMTNGAAYDESYGEEDEPDSGNPQLPEGVKMIYRASLELESTEFEKASADVRELTARLGGYFESQSVWNRSGGYRNAEYTVRVPAAKFDAFLSQVGELCTVRHQTQSAENISERYYDMESRLETQKIKLDRLQALLSKAEEMEDIITLESAISETEYQIESLSGELRHYDALINYATINVTLSEVYRVTEQQTAPLTFGQRIARSFREGLEDFGDGAENFLEWLAYSWLSLLVLAAVVFGAVKLIRRLFRRGGKKSKTNNKAEAAAQENAAETNDSSKT